MPDSAPDLILSVLHDQSSPTSLLDGRKVVVDYLEHGEHGLALDHLVYMIVEPRLAIGSDTHRRLLAAGDALNYPVSTFDDVTVR